MSSTRIRVPFFGGASTIRSSDGSPDARSMHAGVSRVFHTSWNTGPCSPPTRCTRGGGASSWMMAFPAALWPVTMRRNGALISFSNQFDADLVSAAWGSRQRARCLGMHPHHLECNLRGSRATHATLGRNPEIAHDG